jgi:hypothetical protein
VNNTVLNGLVKHQAQLAGDTENAHGALRKTVLEKEIRLKKLRQLDEERSPSIVPAEDKCCSG